MFTDLFKKRGFILILVFIIFLVLRIPGLHLPYYQDERIWNGIESSGLEGLKGIVHPPLTAITFIVAVNLLGPDNLRYVPFIFGIINFWLLFFLIRRRFSWNAAMWSVLFFSSIFYSILASLMVDTDGQILPFLFLISATAYYKWLDTVELKNKIIWGSALVVSLLIGFMTKASFVIVFGAIVLDFLYLQKQLLSSRQLVKTVLVATGLLGSFLFLVFGVMYLLPNTDISKTISYWKHFAFFDNRNYLQISIQFLKSLLYVSPLLLVPILFLNKKSAQKLRLFIVLLVLGLVFYLVLFDFSSGALDRYLQFMIVPLSVIVGVVVGNIFETPGVYKKWKFLLISCVVGLVLFLTQFLPHFVPALYPKTEWFSRVLSLRWNFLFPFTGGSGPMGFYVSWLFMAFIWLVTAILAITALIKANWRKQIFVIILVLGVFYNAVFVEEYLFGKINGSSTVLLKNAAAFIKDDNNIKKIISYNNIGNYELSKIGKYERRLYVAPKFEAGYVDIIKNYKGHYLVIDIPRLHSDSPYVKYFSLCKIIYQDNSKNISAKIFDCLGAQFK